jgi:hypothetical protein
MPTLKEVSAKMPELKASPRVNPKTGAVADFLKYLKSPKSSQQMQGLMSVLPFVDDLEQVLDDASYGRAPTQGKGMTLGLTPEGKSMVELATIFAPGGRAAKTAVGTGAMALGRAGEALAERKVPEVMAKGGRPAQLLSDLARGSQSKIFIGPEAKTWDQKAAIKAANMERKGATAAEIWAETGTARGPDKMWRQEISDKSSRYDPGSLEDLRALDNFDYEKHTQPLGGTLEHKGLYAAYPELSDMPVRFSPKDKMQEAYASYSPKNDRMTLSDVLSPEKARSSSLHEIQHAIQERERFGVGGNARDFARMKGEAETKIVDLNQQMIAVVRQMDNPATSAAQKAELKSQYDALMSQRNALVPAAQIDPKNAYAHLMGEAEARLTQRRMDLGPRQRRQNFPFQYTGQTGFGFDVEPSKMIKMTPEGTILERGLLGKDPMEILLQSRQK